VVFALKGQYYWKINDYGVVRGYPKKINRFWNGLPGNINAAAYSKYTGRTYFFKGLQQTWLLLNASYLYSAKYKV